MTPETRRSRLRRANAMIAEGMPEADAFEAAGLLSPRARLVSDPPDTFEGVCRWFEGVAGLLAPEVAGTPFYVLALSDAGDKWGGLFAPTMAAEYQAAIGERWRGPGTAIAVNASLWAGADPLSWEWSRVLIGVLLHELAHALTVPPELRCITPSAPELTRELTQAFLLDAPIRCGVGAAVLWQDHGGDFVRVALHLHARMERLGVALLRPHLVVDCEARGLSPTEDYADALGSEPERCERWTFEAIASTRPPQRFIDLWKADTKRVFMEREPATTELTEAVIRAAQLYPPFPERKNVMSLIESLRRKLAAREQDAESAYAALVAKVASGGKVPDVEAVAAILGAAGKTADGLEQDVARRCRRMELVSQVARRESLQRQEAALLEKIKVADKALEEADQRHSAAIYPLTAEVDEIRAEIQSTYSAATELEKTSAPELRSELEAIFNEREALRLEAIELREERQRRRDAQARAEQTAKKWSDTPLLIEGLDRSPVRRREAEAAAKAAAERVKAIDQELAAIAKQDARLADEESEVRARMRTEA